MGGQKDKDYHKLRNPEKYGLLRRKGIVAMEVKHTEEGFYAGVEHYFTGYDSTDAEAEREYEKLHYKYGGKSMVANKRRRCTTRHSNANYTKVMRRIERARGKEETRKAYGEMVDERQEGEVQ